jgi:hypothetical protein
MRFDESREIGHTAFRSQDLYETCQLHFTCWGEDGRRNVTAGMNAVAADPFEALTTEVHD